MKNIPIFENFIKAINEGNANPDEVAVVKDLEKAMLSNFSNVAYQMKGKDDKYYDYSKGYVHVSNKYQAQDWSWIDPKRAKILQNCNFSSLYIKASYTYSETISNAEPIPAKGGIGVSGDSYINYYKEFTVTNPKKVNLSKEVKDWIKFSQKQPINDDLLKTLFTYWKATKTDYKTINTRDQGYGSQASVHITKSYDKAYVIKDLNVALGKTEGETEEIIKAHYMFKKDRLDFDWTQGVMIVGGQYTEVWD
jgi:hypothetical protein